MDSPADLAGNVERVRARIAAACRRSGRQPSAVTLVAVTKTVPIERIQQVLALSMTDLGENRVQEARAKRELVPAAGARWHLIGHLQRNKAKDAVNLFDAIHSVDSADLVDEIAKYAARRVRPIDLMVQVNVAGESTKSGCAPSEAASVATRIIDRPGVTLIGLMTIPPLGDPEQSRPHFRRLRELRDELARSLGRPLQLSMGMSNDFEIAIEEGADLIRVGTALFGERPAHA